MLCVLDRRRPTRCASGWRTGSSGAYEELPVTTFHGFCARLLRDEALEAGLDPFATPVGGGRPAGDAARADRRPAAAPPRPARQPERDARRDRPAHRPPQGRARLRRRLRRVGDARLAPRTRAAREREFAALYAAHERMLADAGTLDVGDLVLQAFRLLRERAARARAARPPPAARARRRAPGRELRPGPAAAAAGRRPRRRHRGGRRRPVDPPLPRRRDEEHRATSGPSGRAATVVRLEQLAALGRARSCAPRTPSVAPAERPDREGAARRARGGEVAFWRCASERAQAQAVAAEVERLVAREDVAPEDVCVLVRSVRGEGQAVAVAFEERAVPYRLSGAAAFFQRAEVRDLLAWLRLLVDPGDAGAVVRALARPPVELRAIDLARVTQIARRRKLDMVAALGAALESPQIPPEARERITHFLRLHRAAAGGDRLHAPGPVRAPADRAARAAPPAAVRGLDRGRRAAAEPRPLRRAGRRLRAPLAAGHRPRLRALDRRRRRGRPARGGGGRRAPARRAA